MAVIRCWTCNGNGSTVYPYHGLEVCRDCKGSGTRVQLEKAVIEILDPKTVVRHIARVRVGDLLVDRDLFHLLEELHSAGQGHWGGVNCRGGDDYVRIKDLERRGLARQATKGSWYAGPELDFWLKLHSSDVLKALDESQQRAYPFAGV